MCTYIITCTYVLCMYMYTYIACSKPIQKQVKASSSTKKRVATPEAIATYMRTTNEMHINKVICINTHTEMGAARLKPRRPPHFVFVGCI